MPQLELHSIRVLSEHTAETLHAELHKRLNQVQVSRKMIEAMSFSALEATEERVVLLREEADIIEALNEIGG